MKHTTWISILALAVAATACGDDTSGEEQDVSDVLALTGNAQMGGAVYTGAGTCATLSCHGPTGDDGATGAPLSTVVPNLSIERIAIAIRYGADTPEQSGSMAALPDLSAQQIADVAAYLKETPPWM